VEYNDTNVIAAVTAKTNAFEEQLGLEYDEVVFVPRALPILPLVLLNGLDQIDFSSEEGQRIATIFYTLQQKCEILYPAAEVRRDWTKANTENGATLVCLD
jgi:hypothetical protein